MGGVITRSHSGLRLLTLCSALFFSLWSHDELGVYFHLHESFQATLGARSKYVRETRILSLTPFDAAASHGGWGSPVRIAAIRGGVQHGRSLLNATHDAVILHSRKPKNTQTLRRNSPVICRACCARARDMAEHFRIIRTPATNANEVPNSRSYVSSSPTRKLVPAYNGETRRRLNRGRTQAVLRYVNDPQPGVVQELYPWTAMCVRNVDVHVSCSSHVDAQLAAFFIDPRAK